MGKRQRARLAADRDAIARRMDALTERMTTDFLRPFLKAQGIEGADNFHLVWEPDWEPDDVMKKDAPRAGIRADQMLYAVDEMKGTT